MERANFEFSYDKKEGLLSQQNPDIANKHKQHYLKEKALFFKNAEDKNHIEDLMSNQNVDKLVTESETPVSMEMKKIVGQERTYFPELVANPYKKIAGGQIETVSKPSKKASIAFKQRTAFVEAAADSIISLDSKDIKDIRMNKIKNRKTTEIFGLKFTRQIPPTSFDARPLAERQKLTEANKSQQEVSLEQEHSETGKSQQSVHWLIGAKESSESTNYKAKKHSMLTEPTNKNPSEILESIKSKSSNRAKLSSHSSFGSKSLEIGDNVSYIHKKRKSKGAGAAYQLVRQCLDNDSVCSTRASLESVKNQVCKEMCRDFVRDYVRRYEKQNELLAATMSVRLELRQRLRGLDEQVTMDQMNRCDNLLEDTLTEFNDEVLAERNSKNSLSLTRVSKKWIGKKEKLKNESCYSAETRQRYAARQQNAGVKDRAKRHHTAFAPVKSFYKNVTTYKDFAVSTEKFVNGSLRSVGGDVWNVSREAVNRFLREQTHIYNEIFNNDTKKGQKFNVWRNPFRY